MTRFLPSSNIILILTLNERKVKVINTDLIVRLRFYVKFFSGRFVRKLSKNILTKGKIY